MNYNQFRNISCYEEFEIKSALTGISKIDVLKGIGNKINDYYFFISNDGIFNWFDLEGNHTENPGILKTIKEKYIPKNITKCIIPDSVTYISDYAFYYCDSLKEITIPNSVTNIGIDVFYNCKLLKEITIPDSVKNIKYNSFFYCYSLKEIIIPDGVTSVGDNAFSFCESLKSITIPDSITSIGEEAFSHCKSLKEVIFKGKILEEVKQMKNYPFGIADESAIKVS